MSNYLILYIYGSGHSGSTLLNLLLNAHPQVTGLSELRSIQKFLNSPLPEENPLQHSYWRTVAECWTEQTGRELRDLRIEPPSGTTLQSCKADYDEYVAENKRLLDCVAKVSESTVLVDSSKNLARLEMLSGSGIPLKLIHLIRDGRAVLNSYRRKNVGYITGFRKWFRKSLFSPRVPLLGQNKELEWILVRYEDLAVYPEDTLRRICTFAGLEFHRGMLEYWNSEDVSIGGNRMRKTKAPIRLDEKWIRELPAHYRITFAILGGWLNKLYGYPLIRGYRPVLAESKEQF